MVISLSPKNTLSLYFHIPFCKRKCDYCHFYVIPDKEEHKVLLLDGFRKDWEYWLNDMKGYHLSTIYFGGGTPSLFGPNRIAEVLSWINKEFPFKNFDPEITLEANPENITLEMMEAYRSAGINRVSIGVQSLNNSELTLLTRQHDSQKAIDAIKSTYDAGIKNISIDLMYDLPSQTINQWKNTLKQVGNLPISHLSLYNLTIEPHTVFDKYKETLISKIPNDEISLEMYSSAIDIFESYGFKQYEISAFAKEGKISQHNTGYWTGRPFLGIGPSAFSYWKGERFRNIASIHKYVKKLDAQLSPIDYRDELTSSERKRELLVVALRLIDGVDILEFENSYGRLEEDTHLILKSLIQDKLLSFENSRYALTKKGIVLYDYVASELI